MTMTGSDPNAEPAPTNPPGDVRGLECRHCGCRHFHTIYTRPKQGYILRLKECRYCGHRMTTRERAGL